MIQLAPSCLILQTDSGKTRLCSIVEAIMESRPDLGKEPELTGDIAAVLGQYFLDEQKKSTVTYEEFQKALKVICQFLKLPEPGHENDVLESSTDLMVLVKKTGNGFEMVFFQLLRCEVQRHVDQPAPRVIFAHLREAVIVLCGAKKWSPRCERLHDQIINFIRACFSLQKGAERSVYIS